MTGLRETLRLQLARFDDEAFAALANRGLLRRARKDLEKAQAEVIEDTPNVLALQFAGHRVTFDARGPTHATCSCPARGGCHHIVAAAIVIGSLAPLLPSGSSEENVAPAAGDSLEELQQALQKMTPRELEKYAGKVGYRWAWQYVNDLDIEHDLKLAGERNVVISFRHPPVSLRYMGGSVDAILPDVDVKKPENFRVAAVLAFQRAHGKMPQPLEESGARAAALDLGKDHERVETGSAALANARSRLTASVRQLVRECLTLGLAHLSAGIHERFATLAVWAQGAQCHRLALLLRRIADHVEMLLDRASGADEQRLLEELALVYALANALESAAARGAIPAALIGRARNEYEDVGQLELLGLGASAWRSASGYLGLTMLFWSPAQKAFYSCTDGRPELQRGFDPVARYKAPGPWAALGAPVLATGRRVILTGALTSAAGRISGSEKTNATIMPADAAAFVAALPSQSRWSEVARERATLRRSLLAEPRPLKDWAILHPKEFKRAEFDQARQTMVWGLIDDQGETLTAEVAYGKFTEQAIDRIEQLTTDEDLLVVARLRGGSTNIVAEPLSLIRTAATGDDCPVDSLYFDAPSKPGIASRLLARLRRRTREAGDVPQETVLVIPPLLSELRQFLRLQAERGLAADTTAAGELTRRLGRLSAAGFSVFGSAAAGEATAEVLRAQYLCMQYEHLLDDSAEGLA